MDYIGSHQNVNWLFILFLFSCFQWLLTSIYLIKYKKKLFSKIPQFKINTIPFTRDYYYMYWNIYPIIFYLYFYSLDSSFSTYLSQLLLISDVAKSKYDTLFTMPYVKYMDLFVLIIAILLGYKATFGTQLKKQLEYIKDINEIRWWDIRLSKEIFWIRFLFLFSNTLLMAFVVYLLTKVLILISLILINYNSLHISPFHPDHYGGLHIILEISSIILSTYLLRSVMGIVGVIDHKDIKTKHYIDYYHIAYLFLGIYFLSFLVYNFKEIFANIDTAGYYSKDIYLQFIDQLNKLSPNEKDFHQILSNFNNYYASLNKFGKNVIDFNLFSTSFLNFVIPLSLWFFFEIIKNKNIALNTNKIEFDKIEFDKYKKYFDKIFTNPTSNIVPLLISVLVYIAWIIFDTHSKDNYSYLNISLGHVGYIILLLLPPFLVSENKTLQKLWIFIAGITILDLPALMYVVNNQSIDPSIYTNKIMLAILLFLILVSIFYGISKPEKHKIKKQNLLIVFASSLFFILVYHGANYYLKVYKNVLNEDRSIFIHGLEFHHINYGLVLLVLVPFLFKYASKFTGTISLLLYLFIGFIYGTVFDECYYYMLRNMTDEAYLYPNVFFTQIIFMSLVFSFWYYLLKRKEKHA